MVLMFGTILAGLVLPQIVSAKYWVPKSVANGTYEDYGCWFHPNLLHNRNIISGGPMQSDNMTMENCAAYCGNPANGGPFNYFGVTDGNKCYCGHTLYVDKFELRKDAYCGTQCTGATRQFETCGGPAAMSVYSRVPGRTRGFKDLPDNGEGMHPAGCYAYSDIQSAFKDGHYLSFENANTCAWTCRWTPNQLSLRTDFYAFAIGITGFEEDYLADPSAPSCTCYSNLDLSKIKPVASSNCNMTCGHDDKPGDYSEWCGGDTGYVLLYSNVTRNDLDSASKATSLATWSSSILAASTSRYTARSTKLSSKLSAATSRASAATRVSASKITASSSRSTRRSLVNSSKTAASTSRVTARITAESSKISASLSRTSARIRVSASTSTAISLRSARIQSLATSKTSWLSRYTYSSLSKFTAVQAYSTSSSLAAASRSSARSEKTSSSLSRYSSLTSNNGRISTSRSNDRASRTSVNKSRASMWTSASLSRSKFYSSKSMSAYYASSSRAAAKSAGGARYGEVLSVLKTVIVDTSSSELPFTETATQEGTATNADYPEMTS